MSGPDQARLIIMDFKRIRCLSFDCYGTLIDWESGLLSALRPTLENRKTEYDKGDLLEMYAALESDVESEAFRSYREVLAEVYRRLARALDFSVSEEEVAIFSDSVKNWLPFGDSQAALRALQTRYRLIILSNIDSDMFDHSEKALGIKFDEVFTAQQIGSYKPSRRNFQFLLDHSGCDRSEILHVAQSLFHDIVPAKEMDMSTVWVNRRSRKKGFGATPPSEGLPDLEVPDLNTLVSLLVD